MDPIFLIVFVTYNFAPWHNYYQDIPSYLFLHPSQISLMQMVILLLEKYICKRENRD